MSRISGKNTKPEMIVRSLLHRLGYRFRLHDRKLPGCPDMVLPKKGLRLMRRAPNPVNPVNPVRGFVSNLHIPAALLQLITDLLNDFVRKLCRFLGNEIGDFFAA